MATTVDVLGRFAALSTMTLSVTGDRTGQTSFGYERARSVRPGGVNFDVDGDGGYSGYVVVPIEGVTLVLAHAKHPFWTGGDTVPAEGYAPSGIKRLKILRVENYDAENYLDVLMPPTGGIGGVGFVADQLIFRVQPQSEWVALWNLGTDVMTTGTNDGLLLKASTATVQARVTAIFGD